MVSGQSRKPTTRAIYVENNIEALLGNHFCSEKNTIIIIYSDCMFSVALGTQHAMRIRLLYCHLLPLRLFTIFPNYLKNGTIFKTIYWAQSVYFWFFLHLLSETFLILSRTQRDMTKMFTGLHIKYPFSYQILKKLEFFEIFLKNARIPNFVKIRPV
jgi:hypothetical protein